MTVRRTIAGLLGTGLLVTSLTFAATTTPTTTTPVAPVVPTTTTEVAQIFEYYVPPATPPFDPAKDLDKLGAEGWELITVVPYGAELKYYFKRAVE